MPDGQEIVVFTAEKHPGIHPGLQGRVTVKHDVVRPDAQLVTAPRGLRLALANRELYLDVPEKVVRDYKDALEERILSVGRELDALNLRMSNPNYVERAPAHLVKETTDQIKEKEALISRLKTELEII